MRKTGLYVGAIAVSLLCGAPDAARAQDAAYCAYAGGRDGYENCGYYSLRQCLDAVSGVGGACRPNPRYGSSNSPSQAPYSEPPPRRRVVRPQ